MKSILSKFIFGFLVGGAFLYMTLRQIDFSNFWGNLLSANYFLILPAVLIYILGFAVRGIRWQHILTPLKRISSVKLFSLMIMGFFMNSLLPLRLGEIIRAHITGQKIECPRSSVLATIVVERLFDSLAYLFLFIITIIFLPFPIWVRKTFTIAGFVFIGGFIFLYILSHNNKLATKILTHLPLPGKLNTFAQKLLTNFIDGLKILKNFKDLAKIFTLSITVWTLEATVYLIISYAFGLQLNLLHCILVMAIIATGSILPTAPGYVGTMEFLGVASLAFLGVEKNSAFAFIVTLHAMQLFTIFMLGIRGIVREKISFSDMLNIANKKE
ncbi:lysylphosphatidylglycerol synthase transmembrane domain-containing protein [Elusimicrobiota bacterium]